MQTTNFNPQNSYQASKKLDINAWITPAEVPDPENLPEPLGWCVLVRPYKLEYKSKSNLIMPDSEADYLNYVTNIGRVVAIGPCAFNRKEHHNKSGEQFDWVKVGDFVTWPKNAGSRRKYKGVGYMLLVDDDLNERLPDPQVFDASGAGYRLDIPEDHFTKYNTYKSEHKDK